MATASQQQEQLFERFEAYDFENDATFQVTKRQLMNK